MQVLRQFSIPIKGLKPGNHKYEFEMEDAFFGAFPDSPIQKAKLKVDLDLEKKSDHYIIQFDVEGTVETECDRCTATIQLPLDFSSEFIIKFDEDEREEEELIYIHPESHFIKLADLLYEQTLLAMPLIKVYDCEVEEPRPCNKKVLDILNSEKEEGGSNNPFGEVLKDLKITKN